MQTDKKKYGTDQPVKLPKIYVQSDGKFIERGGYFPALINHNNTAYVCCRTNAGHLGRLGQITMLSSTNGVDWQKKALLKKKIRMSAILVFLFSLTVKCWYLLINTMSIMKKALQIHRSPACPETESFCYFLPKTAATHGRKNFMFLTVFVQK